MKVKKQTELVYVEYWDCGNPNHRHKIEAVAQACAAKREKQVMNNGARKWTKQACAQVFAQYRTGVRKCDLARSIGISSTRLHEVLAKAERFEREAALQDPFYDLSVRTRNILWIEKLRTVGAVREALASGVLESLPNVGKVTITEVNVWLENA